MNQRTSGHHRGGRAILAIASILASATLFGVANAEAATQLSGTMGKGGGTVKLAINDDATVSSFEVENADIPCKHGTLKNADGSYHRFQQSAPGSFSGKLSESSGDRKFKFKSRDAFRGAAAADGSWTGTFKTKTRVLKHGRKIDKCRLSTGWIAT